MKPLKIALINAALAGALVTFGSFTPLLVGEITLKGICVGVSAGILSGIIIFLNKFNDWFKGHQEVLFNFV